VALEGSESIQERLGNVGFIDNNQGIVGNEAGLDRTPRI
jgi:hypothetical protein